MIDKSLKLLSLLIVVFYLTILWQNAYNIPNADDFELLRFAINLFDSESWSEKLQLIFAKHNEHFVAIARIATLFSFFTLGKINFAFLIILGNVALLATAYILSLNNKKLSAVALFILCATLLQPQHAQSALWATSSLAMLSSTFFAVVSFYLIRKDTTRFKLLLVFVCCILALVSQGNGLFAFLICSLLLLLEQRKLAALFFFLSFISILTVFYSDNVGQSAAKDLPSILLYFAKFTGSALSFGNSTAALFSGIAILVIFSFLTSNKSWKTTPLLWGTLLFCLLTALANALSRADLVFDLGANTSRYRFISALIIAAILLILANKEKWRGTSVTFAAIFFCFSQISYSHYATAIGGMLQDSAYRWQIGETGPLYPNREHGVALLKEAILRDLYDPPLLETSDVVSSPTTIALPDYTRTIVKGFDHLIQNENYLLLDGWAAVPKIETKSPKIYIVLHNDKTNYTFTTKLRYRPDVTPFFKDRYNYDKSGFFALIPKRLIPKGKYIRGVLIEQDGVSRLRFFSPAVEVN